MLSFVSVLLPPANKYSLPADEVEPVTDPVPLTRSVIVCPGSASANSDSVSPEVIVSV